MDNKFIVIDLNDSRSKEIAEIIGNKTCKKIVSYLAEVRDASEKDISDKLSIPMNTVEYNLNKLIKAGLIEKTKNFFWSVKGRRIDMYRLSNKKIVISPKTFSRGIIPSIVAVFLGAFGIRFFMDKIRNNEVLLQNSLVEGAQDSFVMKASPVIESSFSNDLITSLNLNSNVWLWFLFGGLFVILFFILWNYFKKMKGGFYNE